MNGWSELFESELESVKGGMRIQIDANTCWDFVQPGYNDPDDISVGSC